VHPQPSQKHIYLRRTEDIPLLGEQERNVISQEDRISAGVVSFVRHSILSNQELFKIPSDIIDPNRRPGDILEREDFSHGGRANTGEIGIDRMSECSIHIDLLVQREFGLEIVSRSDPLES